jgi:endoglucanase
MFLEEYSNICSSAGDEEAIRNKIKEDIENFVDKHEVNAVGNLIAKKNSKKGKPILITAHMDEVGMIVTDIDSSGFIKFTTAGGIVPKVLPATHVKVGPKEVAGFIALKLCT